ncbi:hypothetical protein [Moellerella wisconsensis]|uniref:Uncharacterized protein n=1 Tax=Moellerella wisconsensis TaxID=158849 RepID=A0A9Q8Q3Q7_9GAMM|nr:hypothetical protein [Moellerella wisconsensis]UNH31662.1 hypothetical protein MNY72_05035 [Moellerella wisconsensis]
MTSIERQATFVTNDAPIRVQSGQPIGFSGSHGAAIIVIDGSQFQSTPIEPNQNKIGGITMGRKEFYLSLAGIFLTIIGSVWIVSNRITDSVNDSRKELQSSINSNKQEIATTIDSMEKRVNDRFTRIDSQFEKMESRIDKAESKIDESLKETNKNINELKNLIIKSK